MKTFVICTVLLWLAFWGYAYQKNPTGVQKVGKDITILVQSLLPAGIGKQVSANDAPEETEAPPAPKVLPTIVAPSYIPPAPVKGWVPPNPLPAQSHWTWTTNWGKSYE